MRLTTFTDYSLRTLIYLGTYKDQRVTVGEIATAYNISKNHLMKVILFLASENYVETVRGKDGGVQLKMPPEELHIGEVVRKSEMDSVLVECFSPGPSDCRIEKSCVLRGALYKATEAFYSVLDKYTLADLLVNLPVLKRMLEPEIAMVPQAQSR